MRLGRAASGNAMGRRGFRPRGFRQCDGAGRRGFLPG
jgi:hypothetical protein